MAKKSYHYLDIVKQLLLNQKKFCNTLLTVVLSLFSLLKKKNGDKVDILLLLFVKQKKAVLSHCICPKYQGNLGPVVQSIISLTSLLVVKILTLLVSTISNSQVFFAEKMWVALANANVTHILSAKILANMPYLMIKVLTIC